MAMLGAKFALSAASLVLSGAKLISSKANVSCSRSTVCDLLRKLGGRIPFLRIVQVLLLAFLVSLTLSFLSIPITFYSLIIIQRDLFTLMPNNNTNESNNSFILNCSEDFFASQVYNYCRPSCHHWAQYPHSIANILRQVEGLSAALGILFSIVTLIIAAFRHRIIFNFPTVFIPYTAVSYFVRDLFFLITAIGTTNLYCSSDDLFSTLQKPTVFCIVSGVVNQYTSIIVTYWWLCLISVTFYKLVFPFHARSMQMQGYFKHYHFILVTIGLIIPLPGIVAALSENITQGYSIDTAPPTACIASNSHIQFYSVTFVNIIFTSIYSVLLIFITWIIHKHEGGDFGSRNINGIKLSFTSAERKLIFLFFLNIVLGTFSFISLAVYSAQKDNLVHAGREYFTCEAAGTGERCDRTDVEGYSNGGLVLLFETSTAFLPLGPLFYVTNWSTVKGFIKGFILKCYGVAAASVTLSIQEASGLRIVNTSSSVV